MIATPKMLSVVIMVLVICTAATAAHATDITGKWDSNQGPMTISKAEDGSYSVTFRMIKGKATGTLSDNVFKGSWVREKEDLAERCKSEKDGSPFWGGFKVTFYEGIGFQGGWHFCGDEVRIMNWTGARPKP